MYRKDVGLVLDHLDIIQHYQIKQKNGGAC